MSVSCEESPFCNICEEEEGEKCTQCTYRVCATCRRKLHQPRKCPACRVLCNFLAEDEHSELQQTTVVAVGSRVRRIRSRAFWWSYGLYIVIASVALIGIFVHLVITTGLLNDICGPRGNWGSTLAQCQISPRPKACCDQPNCGDKTCCSSQAQKDKYDHKGGFEKGARNIRLNALLSIALLGYLLVGTGALHWLRPSYLPRPLHTELVPWYCSAIAQAIILGALAILIALTAFIAWVMYASGETPETQPTQTWEAAAYTFYFLNMVIGGIPIALMCLLVHPV